MRPSEFWAQIFALPEQARQAESEAAELRIRADALTAWARRATSAHRDALFAADSEQMGRAVEILSALPSKPSGTDANAPKDERPAPDIFGVNKRKQRSDAGKTRVRVGTNPDGSPKFNGQIARRDTDDESAPANPAVVKTADAARVKLAGQIRLLLSGEPDPQTASWIRANIDTTASIDEIGDALKLLSLASWRMRREGDSQPVEVWGTWRQLREHIERAYADRANDDEIAQDLAIRVQDVKFALETR